MYQYEDGSARWANYESNEDVRSYRAEAGWRADAGLIEYHPITGEFLGQSEWWVKETKVA
ncbi:MAG: hypothetical protein ABL911_06875 [Gallionella sp.]